MVLSGGAAVQRLASDGPKVFSKYFTTLVLSLYLSYKYTVNNGTEPNN
jgi:hypothetical protein